MQLLLRIVLRLVAIGCVWMMLVSPAYRLIETAIPNVRQETSVILPRWEAFLPLNIFGTVEWNGWALCGAVSLIPFLMMITGLVPRAWMKGRGLTLFAGIGVAMSLAPWFIDTYSVVGFGAALEATFDVQPQPYPLVPLNGLLWWNAAFVVGALSYAPFLRKPMATPPPAIPK